MSDQYSRFSNSEERPTLPNVDSIFQTTMRLVAGTTDLTEKNKHIDLCVQELEYLKSEGRRIYYELSARGDINDPDQYWAYDSKIESAMIELGQLRQHLELKSPGTRDHVYENLAKSQDDSVHKALSSKTTNPRLSDADMTVKQLAAYLNVSVSWVYKSYASEGLPHYKLNGTSLRFRKDGIEKWKAGRETKGS